MQFADELQRWFVGETFDLSSGGIGFYTSHALPPLSRIEIRFPGWPSDQPSLFAVVRWSQPGRPGRMGVRFPTANTSYMKLVSGSLGVRVAPGIFVPNVALPKTASLEVTQGWRPRLSRYSCVLPVTCGAPGGGVQSAEMFDISAQGMGLRARRMVEPGADLWAQVEIPGNQHARVEGIVAWSLPNSIEYDGDAMLGIHVEYADARFYDLFIHRLRCLAHRWDDPKPAA